MKWLKPFRVTPAAGTIKQGKYTKRKFNHEGYSSAVGRIRHHGLLFFCNQFRGNAKRNLGVSLFGEHDCENPDHEGLGNCDEVLSGRDARGYQGDHVENTARSRYHYSRGSNGSVRQPSANPPGVPVARQAL